MAAARYVQCLGKLVYETGQLFPVSIIMLSASFTFYHGGLFRNSSGRYASLSARLLYPDIIVCSLLQPKL
jgi:hypothetical protein